MQFLLSEMAFIVMLHILLLVVGFLFVLDFPLKKPSFRTLLILIAFVAITVGSIFAFSRFRVPPAEDKNGPIMDGIMEEIYDTTAP